ncbi:MAG: DUF2076 domain-containing protein [Burkholderiales bacterium]
MSPQETQALQTFLNQLTQVQGIVKDPQADALIASAVAQQPDAAYLLVQRALLMEQAVNAAKAQIATLQTQLQSAQSATPGFLDGANAWGNSAAVVARPATPMMSSPAATAQVPMQTPPQAAAPGFFSGNAGSILGTVAATAAGVAGGAFLFQGIENLMGHHHNASGFLDQPGMAPSAAPPENTTINNFLGTDKLVDDATAFPATDDFADFTSTDDGSALV